MSPIDKSAIAKQLQTARAAAAAPSNFHKFAEGKNVLRIFAFAHTANPFDIHRSLIDTKDDVGKVIETFFAQVTGVFEGRVARNCLPRDCPLRERYWGMSKEERKSNSSARPSDSYMVNAVDLTTPASEAKGMQTIRLPATFFTGPVGLQGQKIGYGVLDFFQGWSPPPPKPGDEEQGVQGGASMQQLAAYGDALFGPNGMDFILYCKGSVWMGKPTVQPHRDRQGGCVMLRGTTSPLYKRLDPRLQQQVKDLLLEPRFYPGWASDGRHLGQAGEFEHFCKTGQVIQSPLNFAGPLTPSGANQITKPAQPGIAVEDEEPAAPPQRQPPPAPPLTTVQPALNTVIHDEPVLPTEEKDEQLIPPATTEQKAQAILSGETPTEAVASNGYERGTKVVLTDAETGLEFQAVVESTNAETADLLIYVAQQTAEASKAYLTKLVAENPKSLSQDGAFKATATLKEIRPVRRRGRKPKAS